ncbi:MAG: hypothetical protein ABSE77_19570 [Acidimicrobiales bacterium]
MTHAESAAEVAFLNAVSQIAATVTTRDQFDRRTRPLLRGMSLHGYTDKDAMRDMRRQARQVFYSVQAARQVDQDELFARPPA